MSAELETRVPGLKPRLGALAVALAATALIGCASLAPEPPSSPPIDLGSRTVAVLTLRGEDAAPMALDAARYLAVTQAIGSRDRGVIAFETRTEGQLSVRYDSARAGPRAILERVRADPRWLRSTLTALETSERYPYYFERLVVRELFEVEKSPVFEIDIAPPPDPLRDVAIRYVGSPGFRLTGFGSGGRVSIPEHPSGKPLTVRFGVASDADAPENGIIELAINFHEDSGKGGRDASIRLDAAVLAKAP